MIIAIILIVIASALLGEVVGVFMRRAKITKLLSESIKSPLYDVYEELSPAEFGYLIDGGIGTNERISEFVYMQQNDLIDITRTTGGALAHKLDESTGVRLSRVQIDLLHSKDNSDKYHFKGGISTAFGSNRSMRKVVEISLVEKGWIHSPKRSFSTFLSFSGPAFVLSLLSTMVAIFVFIAGQMGSVITRGSSSGYVMAIFIAAACFAIPLLASFVWSIAVSYRKRYFLSNTIGSNATAKLNQNWDKLNRLAIYLKVSGMDTMTPDYTSLNFKDLDKLYPYAVALGADPKIVDLLTNKTKQVFI